MARLGRETWFSLGDRDLATHLHRTALLRGGARLSAATAAVVQALGVRARLVPMSDDRVRTRVRTPAGWLGFQEFFVRAKGAPEVLEVVYEGAGVAAAAPGVLDAIRDAEAVVVGCSNPVTSIGPILAVPGITKALAATGAAVAAVSPIVGGAPVSGPAGTLLRARGLPVSAESVARLYAPWLDVLVLDERDGALGPAVRAQGARPVALPTLMTDAAAEDALARGVLDALGVS
jgi:LPPG:FO 2-phospho-L-lactate transferase